MALDTSKHYGTAFGADVKHKFVQDGKHFDSAGNEVTADGKKIGKGTEITPAKKDAKATDADSDQVTSQLAGA